MRRQTRSVLKILSLLCLCTLFAVSAASAADLTIGQYEMVSSKRISRTVWEYVYRASVTNTASKDTYDVTSTATSIIQGVNFVDNALSFGTVPSGGTVKSVDTFTIRFDRQYQLNAFDLNWKIVQAAAADYAGTYCFILKETNSIMATDVVINQSNGTVTLTLADLANLTVTGLLNGDMITIAEQVPNVGELNMLMTFSHDGQTLSGTYAIGGEQGTMTGSKNVCANYTYPEGRCYTILS